jgi:hypothetical protein
MEPLIDVGRKCGGDESSQLGDNVFPRTSSFEWCGEWKPKPKKKGKANGS